MLDKSRYGASAFKANKSVQANALRFCYELRSLLQREEGAQSPAKVQQGFTKYYERVHQIITGEARTPSVRQEVAEVFAGDGIVTAVVTGLTRLDFETSKQLLLMFAALITISPPLQASLSSSMSEVLQQLLQGYTDPKLYVLSGQFLRELLQYPAIAEHALTMDTLSALARLARNPIFELSADAIETMKSLLCSDHAFLSNFLASNFSDVLSLMHSLRDSENYFLKRQSLSIIYRMLDNPRNDLFRRLYAREPEHLKYAMTAMKTENARQVKVEAFLLLGVIVDVLRTLPPEQQQQSQSLKIVRKNQERLLDYVQRFGQDMEDEKFHAVKRRLVESLQRLS